MALPISVGDAILLSQIAFGLGQAFSSGRKSAPAEFAEIQDLLYTLSKALKLLSRDLPKDELNETENQLESWGNQDDEENALLSQMIMNCQSTLSHLEALVNKYMDLDTMSAEQKEERRWREEIRKNWKKVLWTKEGGDIAKLKVTLTSHINGLNLAVAAINKRQGRITQDRVHTMHSQLEEIHSWFVQNLQGRKAATGPRSPRPSNLCEIDPKGFTFSVSIYRGVRGENQRFYCPRASFRPDWLDLNELFNSTRSIFQCSCKYDGGERVHEQELNVTLLPSSLVVRVVGSSKPAWHMYASASVLPNYVSSIYIADVESNDIAKLEEQSVRLAVCQANLHLERGQRTGLVSIEPYSTGDALISILNSKTEASPDVYNDYDSCRMTFRANDRHFAISANAGYSILHYKSTLMSMLKAQSLPENQDSSFCIIHQPQAELQLRGGSSHSWFMEETESRYFINVYHDTRVMNGQNPRTVVLHQVLAISEAKPQGSSAPTVQQINCDRVEIEFNESKEAAECLKNLEFMQRDLFIIYVQHPRFGEQVVFQRFVGDIMIRDHLIPSAHMSVVLDPLEDQYRIILLSPCHSVSVCMELPPSILKSLTTDASSVSREYPAYFVRTDMEGTTVVKQAVTLKELVPSGQGESLCPLLGNVEGVLHGLGERIIID